MEEEEPEGEAVAGPSGEATAHSSVNTPPCSSHFSCYQFIYIHFFFSWQMNLLMRKFPGLRQRKRKILTCFTVGCKWGLSCPTGRRGTGAITRGWFSFLFSACCPCGSLFPLYIPTPVFLFPFIFHGAASADKG